MDVLDLVKKLWGAASAGLEEFAKAKADGKVTLGECCEGGILGEIIHSNDDFKNFVVAKFPQEDGE